MDPLGRVHAATLARCYAGRPNQGLREPASSSRCMKLCTFFDQARLALCCKPRKVVRDMPVGPSS